MRVMILLFKKYYIILSFATRWMDLKGIMLREMSHTEKDKMNTMISFIVQSKRQNKQTKTQAVFIHREQMPERSV